MAAYEGGLHYSAQPSAGNFNKVAAVTSAINVAFGRAAPGTEHPAEYLVGTIDGTTGLFRSDDRGVRWISINDDEH